MAAESRLDAREVHARIGSGWRDVLVRLGIDGAALGRKPGPCPACGGRDRFVFERKGRPPGDFFCRRCGGGDAFDLLQRVHGWDFATALREVVRVAGIATTRPVPREAPRRIQPDERARPTARVRDLLRTSSAPSDVLDVVRHLKARAVWPLPKGCSLRAHVGLDYFDDGAVIGRYPCLVAPVVDIVGELVTAHVTHLERGAKLTGHEPRKLLGKLTGRTGCAVRLAPWRDVLGIAEGIETALAAMLLHGVPTWAALSAPVLAKWQPPDNVERVVIFADRDVAGLEAAWKLRDRLTIPVELRVPLAPAKDWADVLASQEPPDAAA